MVKSSVMKTLREYIVEAEKEGRAIGHFNISNLEAYHAILEASRETNLPVIIGTSEGERDFVGINEIVALVKVAREKYNLPIFLNADHTYSLERLKEAVGAGYDAVIFDGAELPLEENIQKTKEAVDFVKSVNPNILVEAELGNIGKSSKLLDEVPEGIATNENFMTSVDDAILFVKETGVDLLAPAVGNMHGMVKGGVNPKINTERIKELREKTGIPLVLHGGSGITDQDFVDSIKAGISIVHINTEIRVVFKESLEQSLDSSEEIAPYKFLAPTITALKEKIKDRLILFNGRR